jgi:hypothetical protein
MMIIGPVLTQQGGYAFDIWTETKGRKPGFTYRRIADAYYARNHEIAEWMSTDGFDPIICNTLAEFMAEIDETSNPASTLYPAQDRATARPLEFA